MRTIATILVCLMFHFEGQAQLFDAQWAIGYNESVLDFRISDTVSIYSLPTVVGFLSTNASICDEAGNLLYYTNGINICNQHGVLLNGNGLNPCPYTAGDSLNGLDIAQAALFIPQPGNTRYYYLFHFSNDDANETRPATIYYSVVDKEGDQGRGEVITKNVPILQGVKLREGGMTACKHANGRDYWIVMGKSNSNIFITFLLTPNGISGPFTQTIGPTFSTPYDVAYSRFSMDGSKYLTGTYQSLLLIMNFDRCSGEFNNPRTIFNNATSDPLHPISGIGAAEFSPNGEFVYSSNTYDLNQYDLSSANIQDSIEIYPGDSTDIYNLEYFQLAPNGKIYISTYNGGLKAYHVINKPDLKGDSAQFVYGGQPTLSISSTNVPNLINYKLGPLAGSSCDTITILNN